MKETFAPNTITAQQQNQDSYQLQFGFDNAAIAGQFFLEALPPLDIHAELNTQTNTVTVSGEQQHLNTHIMPLLTETTQQQCRTLITELSQHYTAETPTLMRIHADNVEHPLPTKPISRIRSDDSIILSPYNGGLGTASPSRSFIPVDEETPHLTPKHVGARDVTYSEATFCFTFDGVAEAELFHDTLYSNTQADGSVDDSELTMALSQSRLTVLIRGFFSTILQHTTPLLSEHGKEKLVICCKAIASHLNTYNAIDADSPPPYTKQAPLLENRIAQEGVIGLTFASNTAAQAFCTDLNSTLEEGHIRPNDATLHKVDVPYSYIPLMLDSFDEKTTSWLLGVLVQLLSVPKQESSPSSPYSFVGKAEHSPPTRTTSSPEL